MLRSQPALAYVRIACAMKATALRTLLVIAALGGALLVPTGSAMAATPSVAQFTRMDYGGGTSVADASQYQFMDLGYPPSSTSQAKLAQLIASIHAADPSTKILLYKAVKESPSDSQGINDCVGWDTTKPYGGIPLSWFLLDATGAPLRNTTYNTYWLDPGNPQVQQACLSSAESMALKLGYDGIFFDMMPSSLGWARLSPKNCSTTSCMSNANWQAAMESFISTLTAGLHAHGLIAIGNIAGGAIAAYGGGPAIWDAYQQAGLDGAMEESFTSGTNHLPVSTTQWKLELANEAWNEANGKYLIANADVSTSEPLNTYGLATVLLAGGGFSSWAADSGNAVNGEYWFPEYNTALGLGAPLGAYSIQSNGLYVRQFQNGTVVVNPTTSAVMDPVYGILGAQSGLIQ